MSACTIVAIIVGVSGCFLVCLIGLIAAIAVPNLLHAIDRGKQKRTVNDIRSIATAVESYAIDYRTVPLMVEWNDVDFIAPQLEPTYIRALPRVDAWQRPIQYRSVDEKSYALRSLGKDGVAEHPPPSGKSSDPNTDIIWENGDFTALPNVSFYPGER
jgi:general secretion pathway protein G